MERQLTIGKLAELAQVNIQTIRYYERRMLLPKPERSASNYRVYTPATARRVRFIKRAKALGFTLSEIGELLNLRATPGSSCQDVRARSEAKIESIDNKVRALKTMRETLSKLVLTCTEDGPSAMCPIIESLEEDL